MEEFLKLLLLQICLVAVGSLLAAVIFRIAARRIEQREVPFGLAYVTMLLAGLANLFVGAIVGLLVARATGSEDALRLAAFLMAPVGLLIQAMVISAQLQIPLGRAARISVMMFAIALVIGLLAAIPLIVINSFTR